MAGSGVGGGVEATHRRRPVDEQRGRIGADMRRDRPERFAADPRDSRLVARTRSSGQAQRCSVILAASLITCSQLSRQHSAAVTDVVDHPVETPARLPSGTPSASTKASVTASGSPSGGQLDHPHIGRDSAIGQSHSWANRVLPAPPGPDDRHQPMPVGQPPSAVQVGFAADEEVLSEAFMLVRFFAGTVRDR